MCRKITKECVWHTGTGKKHTRKFFFFFNEIEVRKKDVENIV